MKVNADNTNNYLSIVVTMNDNINNSIATNDNINDSIPINVGADDKNKIDVGELALKILASIAITITNSLLSLTVSAMKLTGFTIITSLVLGHLTKPLHKYNAILAKYTFTPFKEWAEILGKENERIIETDKVISIEKNKMFFDIKNYKESVKDSFKAIIAPVSLSLSIANAALWLAVKPLWVAILPGIFAEHIVIIPMEINKEIGYLTYTPLKNISNWMQEKQLYFLNSFR